MAAIYKRIGMVRGTDGQGVPAGGAAGMALLKASNADHDGMWAAVGRSNRNLLDNWDFGAPVNQRGQDTYANSAAYHTYTIDRWRAIGTVGVWGGSDCIALGKAGSAYGYGELQQPLANAALTSQTMTYSVRIAGGAYLTLTGKPSDSPSLQTSWGLIGMGVNDSGAPYVSIVVTDDTTMVALFAAKLEIGTVSTLAYDAPMDAADELAKCRQYFRKYAKCIGTVFYTGCVAVLGIDTSGLRVPPTASIGSAMQVGSESNVLEAVQGAENNTVWCTVNSGAAMGTGFYVHDITLSADL